MKTQPIAGFESTYSVTSDGQVISYCTSKPRVLHQYDEYNRMYVRLYCSADKKYYRRAVERLVADSFVPNPNKFKYLRHINGDIADSSAINLVWVRMRECIDCKAFTTAGCRSYRCAKQAALKSAALQQKRDAATSTIVVAVNEMGGIGCIKPQYKDVATYLYNGRTANETAKKYGCSVQYAYRIRKRILDRCQSLYASKK